MVKCTYIEYQDKFLEILFDYPKNKKQRIHSKMVNPPDKSEPEIIEVIDLETKDYVTKDYKDDLKLIIELMEYEFE